MLWRLDREQILLIHKCFAIELNFMSTLSTVDQSELIVYFMSVCICLVFWNITHCALHKLQHVVLLPCACRSVHGDVFDHVDYLMQVYTFKVWISDITQKYFRFAIL